MASLLIAIVLMILSLPSTLADRASDPALEGARTMTAVWQFLSSTKARAVASPWATGCPTAISSSVSFVIFLPVMWIVLNSFKSAFQLDKQDLSLLPTGLRPGGAGDGE